MTATEIPQEIRPPLSPREQAVLMRRATYASIATATILALVKFGAYLLTGSVSMLATLLDSLLDMAASVVSLIGVRQSLMPADAEHRFGHGKAEPLAGLAQATFIAGSSLFLLVEAGRRLLDPRELPNAGLGVGIMVISIAATLILITYQRSVIRRTSSLAIRANSLNYIGDVAVNAGVILALVVTARTGWLAFDPAFAILIGLVILYSAWRVGDLALHVLMDRELPDEDRRRIRMLLEPVGPIRRVHHLRTRSAGQHTFIEFNLEMDGAMTLDEAHKVTDELEARLIAAFPGAQIRIHQEPWGHDESAVRKKLASLG